MGLSFHMKNGLKTIGTDHTKEKFNNGATTNQQVDDLSWAAAAREDSRNLVAGIGEMPEGEDDDIINQLLGEEVIQLMGNPEFMNTRKCAKYLTEQIVAYAKKQVAVLQF